LIEYYEKISEYLLPYLKDRPLSLSRYPSLTTPGEVTLTLQELCAQLSSQLNPDVVIDIVSKIVQDRTTVDNLRACLQEAGIVFPT
jgi:hypothetical protein